MIARSRKATVLAGICTLSLIAAACGDDSSGSSDTTAAATATTAAGAATTAASTATTAKSDEKLSAKLGASGATFPKAFYEEVIDAYTADNPGVSIDYAGGGSG
ncbi:MAG: hypothetical protein AB7Q27_07705, partial [Acidimicrobiia bacterium]